jgi:molybdopterin molybdotransferase
MDSNKSVMISPEKAYEILKSIPVPRTPALRPLEKCLGWHLADDLFADRDFPPFNRVMMDGICVQNLDQNEWPIEGIRYAGDEPSVLNNPNAAVEIMTGAALPLNCQAVIKIEDLEFFDKGGEKWVKTKESLIINEGQFIHFQGMDAHKGEKILQKNIQLGPIEIAIAASIGQSELPVWQKVSIGIFSTGDEIVDISATPLKHQIRASNSYMMKAQLEALSFPSEMAHLADDKELMTATLSKSLKKNQIILLSGGVSAGKKDYIPEVLGLLGFETRIHKIAQKPGKPLWVGHNKEGQVIFAFPGNPISTLLCFYAYFLPWIQQRNAFLGHIELKNGPKSLENLAHWIPVVRESISNEFTHLRHNGSGDLIHWQQAEALVYLAAGSNNLQLPFIPLK